MRSNDLLSQCIVTASTPEAKCFKDHHYENANNIGVVLSTRMYVCVCGRVSTVYRDQL